jgi:hypothetical protein
MNWEAVGAIGEILGAVVVVATIFYLAIQIRHSHRSNQMVAASRIAESADAWLGRLVQDKELNDIYQNGMRDYSSLEQSDQSRFDLLIVQFLRSIEAAWTQDELGVLDKNQWYGYKMTTRHIIGSRGGSVAFDKMRTSFSPAFCTAVEEIISSTEE